MFLINFFKLLLLFILFMFGFSLIKKIMKGDGNREGKSRIRYGARGSRGKNPRRDPGVIELDKNDYHVE